MDNLEQFKAWIDSEFSDCSWYFEAKIGKYLHLYREDLDDFWSYEETVAWLTWQSRQAELDQAYADIETFAQAHQRECDIKVQIANELKEKDKRIAELELALTQIKSWESHPENYETDFGSWGLRDFYRNLADKALRGDHG